MPMLDTIVTSLAVAVELNGRVCGEEKTCKCTGQMPASRA